MDVSLQSLLTNTTHPCIHHFQKYKYKYSVHIQIQLTHAFIHHFQKYTFKYNTIQVQCTHTNTSTKNLHRQIVMSYCSFWLLSQFWWKTILFHKWVTNVTSKASCDAKNINKNTNTNADNWTSRNTPWDYNDYNTCAHIFRFVQNIFIPW